MKGALSDLLKEKHSKAYKNIKLNKMGASIKFLRNLS